jgi:hypothetical protein
VVCSLISATPSHKTIRHTTSKPGWHAPAGVTRPTPRVYKTEVANDRLNTVDCDCFSGVKSLKQRLMCTRFPHCLIYVMIKRRSHAPQRFPHTQCMVIFQHTQNTTAPEHAFPSPIQENASTSGQIVCILTRRGVFKFVYSSGTSI